jgi:hypothetical protein
MKLKNKLLILSNGSSLFVKSIGYKNLLKFDKDVLSFIKVNEEEKILNEKGKILNEKPKNS